MNNNRVFILPLAMLSLILLSSCSPTLHWTNDVIGENLLPAKAVLDFSDPPILNQVVQLTATFTESKNLNPITKVTARITLPEGIQLTEGSTDWQGDFQPGQTYSLKASVKAVKSGTWPVSAIATIVTPDQPDYAVGFVVVYVTVSEKGASLSNQPPS